MIMHLSWVTSALMVAALACDTCCNEGYVDGDCDGECNEFDCDDADPSVYSSAIEICDGKDNNCDRVLLPEEVDEDGDSFYACLGEDCDDADAMSYPGALELCDGLDNNCDGVLGSDEMDADGDSFTICGSPSDCDDTSSITYPGADEVCDGADNNCDGQVETGSQDGDGDGAVACIDCNDSDPGIAPGTPELCDGIDQDCDGLIDATAVDTSAWIRTACGAVMGPSTGFPYGVDQPDVIFNPDLGIYQAWFRMYTTPMSIGYAFSADSVHWTMRSTPVLTVGASGTWDDEKLGYPSVLYQAGQYHMWYQAHESQNKIRIGYAQSSDGVTWEKYVNNPVLFIGGPGTWDAGTVHCPTVLYDEVAAVYRMWYGGTDGTNVRIGYAESLDPVSWVKYDTYVLDVGATGEWDDKRVVFPRVLYIDGVFHLWYSGDDIYNTYSYEIGHATSTNGMDWNRDWTPPENPVFSSSGNGASFDSFMVYAADVIDMGDSYFMYYSAANSSSGPYNIGIAASVNPL